MNSMNLQYLEKDETDKISAETKEIIDKRIKPFEPQMAYIFTIPSLSAD